jgi:tryptophan-rich sensory protein
MTWTIIIAAVLAFLLAAAGGALTEVGDWYHGLAKSRLNPPDWAFPVGWTIILSMLAVSGVLAWHGAHGAGQHALVAACFAFNWVCHLAWSPLFFKFKRPDWALAEGVALWGSVLALVVFLAPISTTASLLNVPYLVWVTFALWLNLTVVRLNGPFGAAAGQPVADRRGVRTI